MTRSHTALSTPHNVTAAREAARRANGEFGVQALAESLDVDLDAVTSLADVDWDGLADSTDLLDTAYRSAARSVRATGAHDRGYSVDDVAQDSLVGLLERRSKGGQVDNVHAYLTSVSRKAAAAAGRSVRAEDFAAYRELRSRAADMSDVLGRALTTTEEKALAEQIRNDWHDQRHKPSVDFVLNVRGREALSEMAADNDTAATMTPLHATGVDNYVEPGSWLDRALDSVEGDKRDFNGAVRMMWNALAERQGAPMVAEASVGHRGVTASRKIVTAETASTLIAAWEDDALTEEQEAALFRPWGEVGIREKAAIVNVLTTDSDYTYGLWDAAMRAASARRSK